MSFLKQSIFFRQYFLLVNIINAECNLANDEETHKNLNDL